MVLLRKSITAKLTEARQQYSKQQQQQQQQQQQGVARFDLVRWELEVLRSVIAEGGIVIQLHDRGKEGDVSG